jgi:flagellar hook-associated protein 1 FlgK
MSLTVALDYAVSGLNATQAQLQVLAGNISNAQTPGYSEETLSQTSDPVTSGGAGVITGEVQRVTDKGLQSAVLNQTTLSSNATAIGNYQQQIQSLLGQVGTGATLSQALNSFQTALQTEATNPQDPTAQLNAVSAGQQLATALNDQSSGIQGLRQSADQQVAADVKTVNSTLNSIASFNQQIAQLQALGQSTASLEDERDQALTQVAQLVGVQSYTRPDGTMAVMTDSGQSLVDEGTAQQFSYTASGNVTASTALSPLTLNGQDVTSATTTGEIGALLQTENTTLPGLTAQLNQFTNSLFGQMSTANLDTTNSGLNTTDDANDFFANVDLVNGVDNASTIEVNPDLVDNPSLLYENAGTPDPTISSNLNEALQAGTAFSAAGGIPATSTTLSNYIGQMIGNAATNAAAASSNSTDQSQLLGQMQSQYSSAVGVNIDTELSTLVIYQNAYAASAHVISTIQDMFSALMNA